MKGQIEGIGTRPRLLAKDAKGETLIDETWPAADVSNVPAALDKVIAFLRQQIGGKLPTAIGHRVVHGGPDYSEPTIVSDAVVDRLERFIPLAPLHQPNNLGPIRAILERQPQLLQVACFDTAFHQRPSGSCRSLCDPRAALCGGRAPLRISRPLLRVHRATPGRGRARNCQGPGRGRASRQRRLHVRHLGRQERRKHHGLHGARWAADGHAAGAARRRRRALPHERERHERQGHRAPSLQRLRPQGPVGRQQRRAERCSASSDPRAKLALDYFVYRIALFTRACSRPRWAASTASCSRRASGRTRRPFARRWCGAFHGSALSSTPRRMPRADR